jgi:hypothetical protein
MKNEFINSKNETINSNNIEREINFSREQYCEKIENSKIERRDFDNFLNECVEIAKDQDLTLDQVARYAEDIFKNFMTE